MEGAARKLKDGVRSKLGGKRVDQVRGHRLIANRVVPEAARQPPAGWGAGGVRGAFVGEDIAGCQDRAVAELMVDLADELVVVVDDQDGAQVFRREVKE